MAYERCTRPEPGQIVTAKDWNTFVVDDLRMISDATLDVGDEHASQYVEPIVLTVAGVELLDTVVKKPVTRRGLLFSVFDIFKK